MTTAKTFFLSFFIFALAIYKFNYENSLFKHCLGKQTIEDKFTFMCMEEIREEELKNGKWVAIKFFNI
jgi:hypothetical protein